MGKELISTGKAAKIIGVQRHTLQNWRNREYGPPYHKILNPDGKTTFLYDVHDIHDWLDQCRVVPGDQHDED